MVITFYQQGDPQLLAIAVVLDAKTPADLIRQRRAQNAVVGHQTTVYADLDAAEILLPVRRTRWRTPRTRWPSGGEDAADHLVAMQGLHRGPAAKQAATSSSSTSRDARQRAMQARQADRAVLAQLKPRGDGSSSRSSPRPAGRRSSNGGYPATGGLLEPPVDG